ncbi:MAG: hypothetical protein JWQ84_1327 [Mucilaginibacter sp.]|nr:hypothetical protein [Mucilaginibacter sp.]
MVIRAFNAADHHHFSFSQHYKPVIYSWSPDSLKSRQVNGKPYLKIYYDGSKSGYCNIAFRVFVVKKGEKPQYSLNSKQYLGSYSLGESCAETFYVPLDEKLNEMKTGSLYFHIIPVTMESKMINQDLKRNFKISTQFR